jgi:hypothetical protein
MKQMWSWIKMFFIRMNCFPTVFFIWIFCVIIPNDFFIGISCVILPYNNMHKYGWHVLRNIPLLPKVGSDLPPLWFFGPRKELVPGREPWSQEVFNLYETSQIKSEEVSDVLIGPCAWRGQNGHIACKDIKGSKKNIIWAWSMITLSLSLSLFLSSLYRHLADLIVGGGPASQPPAGLFCFAGQGAGEEDVSDDSMSPDQKIASTF